MVWFSPTFFLWVATPPYGFSDNPPHTTHIPAHPRNKKQDLRQGKVNKTNMQQGLDYMEGRLDRDESAVQVLLEQFRANSSATAAGAGP